MPELHSPAADPLAPDLPRDGVAAPQLGLLKLTAAVAYAAANADEAFQVALDLICSHTGWPLGHIFLFDAESAVVRSSTIWHDEDPARYAAFVRASENMEVEVGVGLPGRIVASGEPSWIRDVRTDPNFPRSAQAIECGIGAGFGFPIVSSAGVEGTMEFFSPEPIEPDASMLELLSHIGIHLGGVLDRGRAERALEASEASLRELVDSAPDALVVVDAAGDIILVNDETERLTGYPRDELVGRSIDVLVPAAVRGAHAAHRSSFLESPRRRAMGAGQELVLRRADGTEVPVDVSLAPIDRAGGRVVVAAVRDVSERLRAAESVRRSEAQLAEAQRLARIGSWEWNTETGEWFGSAELHRILGEDRADSGPLAEFSLQRVHEDDRDRVRHVFGSARTRLEPRDLDYRVLRADGEMRWIHVHLEPAEVREGTAVRLVGYCQDITERREAEERRAVAQKDLLRHQQVLERILRGEPHTLTLEALCLDIESRYPDVRCSVLIVDPAERVLRDAAGPSLPMEYRRAINGLPVGHGMGACGTAAATGELVVIADTLTDPLTAAFTEEAVAHELRSVWSYPLMSAANEVLGTFALYRSVTHVPNADEIAMVAASGSVAALAIERSRSELALRRAAQVDPLTGLFNRARFLEEVATRLGEPGTRLAVMFLDLDGFKWINDSLGHPAGDRILVEVAARLPRYLRSRYLVARFGGDEFTVLITDASPVRIAQAADDVNAAFRDPFLLDGGEFFLTVSVGIARNDEPVDAYGLVRDADAAMYAAKEAGRARHVLFDERLRERATARVRLESEIRRGIDRDEFVLHYQPIFDLERDAWAGAEALVRWQHPSRGLLLPGDFIPLAEETGLIVPLGGSIIEAAFAQGAEWAAAGNPVRVSVNLSVAQLSDPFIAMHVGELLDRHGLAPSQVLLEVTESAVMEQLDTARQVLEDIAGLGVQLVIDDFGTGYSSISRLAELPVIGIKIDRAFTRGLGEDPRAENVVAAIIHLARALDLDVVAEGVETAHALDRLCDLGCRFVQGYHVALPAPADDSFAVLTGEGPSR